MTSGKRFFQTFFQFISLSVILRRKIQKFLSLMNFIFSITEEFNFMMYIVGYKNRTEPNNYKERITTESLKCIEKY